MILPSFEEKYEAHSPTGYPVTNEEPETIRRMLKGKKFARGASIAGGGEVSIFTILPFCSELYCIDHSHRAIVALYTKLALLQKLGVEKMRELLDDPVDTKFKAEANKVVEHLPEVLRPKVVWETKYPASPTIGPGDYGTLRREWNLFPDSVLRIALKKLEHVKILHGDIAKDLPEYGKFDFLYMSNAFEHVSRNGKTLKVADVLDLLLPKGHLLVAASYGSKTNVSGLKRVASIRGLRTTWTYNLYQKEAATRKRKAKTVEVPQV